MEFIVSSLEEREREEIFRLKWLKTKMGKQEEKARAAQAESAKEQEAAVA